MPVSANLQEPTALTGLLAPSGQGRASVPRYLSVVRAVNGLRTPFLAAQSFAPAPLHAGPKTHALAIKTVVLSTFPPYYKTREQSAGQGGEPASPVVLASFGKQWPL